MALEETQGGYPPMQSCPPPEQMVRALALAMRDKALADARQAMKLVRQIERDYNLTPASTKKEG